MTDYAMLEALYKKDLADKYPQYQRVLDRAAKVYVLMATRRYCVRASCWYEKNDLVLGIGDPTTRPWAPKQTFWQIYAPAQQGLCLAPASHFQVVKVVR